MFCVFSGQGVTGLRQYLNQQQSLQGGRGEIDYDEENIGDNDVDDDQTMTGMMGATALNGDDDDADGDEELEDVDGSQNFADGPPT